MNYQPEANITAEELFRRVGEILDLHEDAAPVVNKMMHDVLVLTCHEGLSGTHAAFGNLFAQVDYLCKRHHVYKSDVVEIQRMRRDSNRSTPLLPEDVLFDCRALCRFIAAVFGTGIPSFLTGRIPVEARQQPATAHIDYRCMRCVVAQVGEAMFTAAPDADSEAVLRVDFSEHVYLQKVLREGMQLNLVDCSTAEGGVLKPSLIVVEPDYLLDISSIARCFTDYGHHPLAFTLNRLQPNVASQPIVLGNFASAALDDIINTPHAAEYQWTDTFRRNFRERALDYCTCDDFDAVAFKRDAADQARNIQEIVGELFVGGLRRYDRQKAILEPSFVCEQLGLQGRVDLMTTDMQLLVEQKSGKNFNIQVNRTNSYGSYQKEEHYVQLLLYYGVLRQNFHLAADKLNAHLLYSKYALPGGLVVVNFYRELFREAMRFRNQVVATAFAIATRGFDKVIDLLTPVTLNVNGINTSFYQRFLLPQLQRATAPLHSLNALEKSYVCRMATFVYREQLAGKVGAHEGQGNSSADLWNMPLAGKKEAGMIYTSLRIKAKERSGDGGGYDVITLEVPDQGDSFLPNFRVGDGVYLYAYAAGQEPDARAAILFKGTLTHIATHELTVHLSDGQQNAAVFEQAFVGQGVTPDVAYAIEHADYSGSSALKGLFALATAEQERRDLLLSQRAPKANAALQLTTSYNPSYDDIVLRAKQAEDFFLLIGPPGTGKTSMALQYMVREGLACIAAEGAQGEGRGTRRGDSLLLMAYTNRAVDEICGMLEEASLDYIRIGNEYMCDERYRSHMLNHAIAHCPTMQAVRQRIVSMRIIVGTTSALQSQQGLFNLKHFRAAIIDEASQILEPSIVGLLSSPQIDKFILIGDHKQLPAVVQQEPIDSAVGEPELQAIGITDCRDSLFERLLRHERHVGREAFVGTLRKQGRMHPDIAAFPNRMFYRRERLEVVPLKHQEEVSLGYDLPSRDALDDALKAHRMLFLPSEACLQPGTSEKVNAHEARIVADLLCRVHRFYGEKFDASRTVGVIVPYRNQIAMIRKEIEKLGIAALNGVSIDTVERYQGSQRDVIVYSFTIQRRYQLDFLTGNCFEEDGHLVDRKLNVAITRARRQMIMTGNEAILSTNRLFGELISHVRSQGGVVCPEG